MKSLRALANRAHASVAQELEQARETADELESGLARLAEKRRRIAFAMGEEALAAGIFPGSFYDKEWGRRAELHAEAKDSLKNLSREFDRLETEVKDCLRRTPTRQLEGLDGYFARLVRDRNFACEHERKLEERIDPYLSGPIMEFGYGPGQIKSEIEQECKEKIAAYLACPYFSYLKNKLFGTPQYRRKGLLRALDNWLARRINFAKYDQDFTHLSNMQEANKRLTAKGRSSQNELLGKARGALENFEQICQDLVAVQRSLQQFDELRDPIAQQIIGAWAIQLQSMTRAGLEGYGEAGVVSPANAEHLAHLNQQWADDTLELKATKEKIAVNRTLMERAGRLISILSSRAYRSAEISPSAWRHAQAFLDGEIEESELKAQIEIQISRRPSPMPTALTQRADVPSREGGGDEWALLGGVMIGRLLLDDEDGDRLRDDRGGSTVTGGFGVDDGSGGPGSCSSSSSYSSDSSSSGGGGGGD